MKTSENLRSYWVSALKAIPAVAAVFCLSIPIAMAGATNRGENTSATPGDKSSTTTTPSDANVRDDNIRKGTLNSKSKGSTSNSKNTSGHKKGSRSGTSSGSNTGTDNSGTNSSGTGSSSSESSGTGDSNSGTTGTGVGTGTSSGSSGTDNSGSSGSGQ